MRYEASFNEGLIEDRQGFQRANVELWLKISDLNTSHLLSLS